VYEVSYGDASSSQLSPLYISNCRRGRHNNLGGSQYPGLAPEHVPPDQGLVEVSGGYYHVG
jgi:hypothetical protein